METPQETNIYQQALKETVESLKGRIPYILHESNAFTDSTNKVETEIDLVTENPCTLRLISDVSLFKELAKEIHGIELREEIIASFIGEFWNLVLAPVIKYVKSYDEKIDISPSKPATVPTEASFNGDYIHHFFVKDWKGNCIGELALYCVIKKGE